MEIMLDFGFKAYFLSFNDCMRHVTKRTFCEGVRKQISTESTDVDVFSPVVLTLIFFANT